jgi:ABC-type tungstate transport system substrate-binding protein
VADEVRLVSQRFVGRLGGLILSRQNGLAFFNALDLGVLLFKHSSQAGPFGAFGLEVFVDEQFHVWSPI